MGQINSDPRLPTGNPRYDDYPLISPDLHIFLKIHIKKEGKRRALRAKLIQTSDPRPETPGTMIISDLVSLLPKDVFTKLFIIARRISLLYRV